MHTKYIINPLRHTYSVCIRYLVESGVSGNWQMATVATTTLIPMWHKKMGEPSRFMVIYITHTHKYLSLRKSINKRHEQPSSHNFRGHQKRNELRDAKGMLVVCSKSTQANEKQDACPHNTNAVWRITMRNLRSHPIACQLDTEQCSKWTKKMRTPHYNIRKDKNL